MFNNILFYLSLTVLVLGGYPIIRYGCLRFYYRYIDKRPFEINIEGFNYIIDPKSKKFIVDQMKRQQEQNKKGKNNENL